MIAVRIAAAADEEAVNRVLSAAYGSMARYDAALLAAVLPVIGRIDRAVLTGGTYYIAEAERRTLGVGGWTFERPGDLGEQVDPRVAHLRFVGTDPGAGRGGIGRAVVDRCVADAQAAGVAVLHSFSTLGAEPFHAALGFTEVGPMASVIAGHTLPSTHMVRQISQPQSPSATAASPSTSAP